FHQFSDLGQSEHDGHLSRNLRDHQYRQWPAASPVGVAGQFLGVYPYAPDFLAINAVCRRNGEATVGYHGAGEYDAFWRWQVVPERGPRALDRFGVQQPPEIRSRAVRWRVEFPRLPAGRLESCAAVPVGGVGEPGAVVGQLQR